MKKQTLGKPYKTAEEYSKNIKILKYHLQQLIKQNQNLKYKFKLQQKKKQKAKAKPKIDTNVKTYKTDQIAKQLFRFFKQKGIPLSALFRMADHNYQGQILNEDLIMTFKKFQLEITQQQLLQIVYSMDTSLNGKIDETQYNQFIFTYGVGEDSQQTFRLETKAIQKFVRVMKDQKMGYVEIFKQIDKDDSGKIDANQLRLFLKNKKAKINQNQIFLILNFLDPSKRGEIAQKTFIAVLEKHSKTQEMNKNNEQFLKQIKKLTQKFKQNKINPIQVFEQADVDKVNGVTVSQLQQTFKKILPKQSALQIKKWISHINFNDDKIIQRDEYMNAILSVYTSDQIKVFRNEYEKKSKSNKDSKIQQQRNKKNLLKQFSDKIEDLGKTKKQIFESIDKNGDKQISIKQLELGLKNMGLHIGLANNLLKIFDKNESKTLSMKQYYDILGQDIQYSDVDVKQQQIIENYKKQSQQKQQKKTIKQEINKNQKQSLSKTKKQQTKKKDQKQIAKKISKKEIKSQQKQNKKQVKKQQNKQLKKQSQNKQSKKQVKIVTKKTFQDQYQNQQQQLFQQQLNQQIIQQKQFLNQQQLKPYLQKISIFFKKNKQKTLMFFYNYDKKKTGYISESSFYKVINNIINLKQDQKHISQSIFSLAKNDMVVYYLDWLQQLSSTYKIQQKETGQLKSKKTIKNTNSINLNNSDSKQKKDNINTSLKKDDKKVIDPKLKKKQTAINKNQKNNQSEKLLKKQSKIPIINKDTKIQEKIKKQQVKKNQEQNDQIQLTNRQKIQQKIGQKRGNLVDDFYDFIKTTVQQKKNQTSGKSNLLKYIIYNQQKIQQFYAKAEKIKKKHVIYTDSEYPPNRESITKSVSKLPQSTTMKWQHITKIFKNPKLFENKIEPSDIHQGALGDCYFLSSLACLSEYAFLIQRLFQYQDLQNGFYGIWLCVDGVWTLVQIDGWIPVRQNGSVVFSRSNQQQLWVILLEKAYAKVYGSYQQIKGGVTIESIRDLSGAPGKYFRHDDKKLDNKQLWSVLQDANNKQYMITAGTDPHRKGIQKAGKSQSVTLKGIVLGHAYSILDVRNIKGDRIIQLRNPWGEVEWNGDWSDGSSKWTSDVKKQLGFENKDDGIFWMPLEQFRKEFEVTFVNYIRPSYYYKTIQTDKKQKQLFIKFNNFSHGYITVSQKDLRHQFNRQNLNYSVVNMVALGMQDDKIKRLLKQQMFGFSRDSCLQISIDTKEQLGIYIKLQKQCECSINYYGKQNIQFNIVQNEERLDEILKVMVPAQGYAISNENIKVFTNSIGDIFYFCIQNLSKKKQCKFSVKVDSVQNLKIESEFKNNLQWNLTIKPEQTRFVRYNKIDKKKGYSVGGYSPKMSFN